MALVLETIMPLRELREAILNLMDFFSEVQLVYRATKILTRKKIRWQKKYLHMARVCRAWDF